MFKWKKSFPSHLVNAAGKKPLAASPIEPAESGEWIAGWATEFAIIRADGSRDVYEWSDFENGSWDDDANRLTLTFVDPRHEPMSLTLPRDADELIITMVHERVVRSIVYQAFRELPSGSIARGQVRRRADESLFVQILVDHEPSAADEVELAELENELREAVGLID